MELSNTADGQRSLRTTLNARTCVNVSAFVGKLISADQGVGELSMQGCSELDAYSTLTGVLDKEALLDYIEVESGLELSASNDKFADTDGNEFDISTVIDGNDIDLEGYSMVVFEYYLVDSILEYALIDAGATVISVYGQSIWCRTCTGQAVIMDYEMEKALTSLM